MSDLVDPEEPEDHKEAKYQGGSYFGGTVQFTQTPGWSSWWGQPWYQQIQPNTSFYTYSAPETTEDKIARHCDRIKNLLIEKNRKYGDSAINPVRIFSQADPAEQLRVRLDDKISRLAQGEMDDDEDVLLDLVGYIVLLLVALENK